MRGKHGNHVRGEKVERVLITCAVCGTVRKYLPGFLRVHPVKYCSRKCYGIAANKKVLVNCSVCKKGYNKRRDKVKDLNYCSKGCVTKSRTVEGAKWRDKEQIKTYMKEYVNKNRDKINERNNKWRNNNQDRRKEVQTKYRKGNKHKIAVMARKRNGAKLTGDLTPEQWLAVLDKYDRTCLCCKKKEPQIALALDHIIPLSKGGRHTIGNVQPLCKSCNSRKSAKTIDYRP